MSSGVKLTLFSFFISTYGVPDNMRTKYTLIRLKNPTTIVASFALNSISLFFYLTIIVDSSTTGTDGERHFFLKHSRGAIMIHAG